MKSYQHPLPDSFVLERVLYALSDPVRLEVVRKLARLAEATCGELDGGRPKSTMSHHFRVLRDSGLVCTRMEGTAHINSLRKADLDGRFPGLLDAVLHNVAEQATDVD